MTRLSILLWFVAIVACKVAPAPGSRPATPSKQPVADTGERPPLAPNVQALQANGAQVVHWTSRDAWRRRILAEGQDWYLKVGAFCPAATRAEEREAYNEFEEKDRERAVKAARQKCFDAMRGEPPAQPAVASLDVAVVGGKYSFDDHVFRLEVPTTLFKGGRVFMLGLDDDTSDATRLRHFMNWNKYDHVLIVALHDSSQSAFRVSEGDGSRNEKKLVLELSVAEEAARALKAPLDAGRLAVEVAFAPERYAPLCTDGSGVWACTGDARETRVAPDGKETGGLVGRAVGYRVRVGDTALTSWAPFGFDEKGTEAKVAMVSEVPAPKQVRGKKKVSSPDPDNEE